ncbi:MAG: STAS domain-containing protein [Planctomycetota bacterium]|jgi:ABC-type transporter Mla MlaB component
MSTSFQIAFTDDGQMQMNIAGSLTGHIARKGFDFLRAAVETGHRKVKLDLRDITSIDSLGIAILDWVKGQNGSLNADILLPAAGTSSEYFISEAEKNSSFGTYSRC